MQNMIIEMIEKLGYLGLFFLIFLENICPPIPSEVILLFSGFMTSLSRLSIIGVLVVSTLASYLGAVFLYIIGRQVSYIKSIFFIKERHLQKAYAYFLKHGQRAIFFGRCIPMVRSLISLPAGMVKMSFFSFSFYTLLGSFLWNALFIGVLAKEHWVIISLYLKKYLWLIGLGVMIVYLKKENTK